MALRDKIVFTSTCCLVSFYLGTQYAEASVPTITNVSTPVPELNIPNTSVPQLSVNYKHYNKETKLYSYATKCTGRNPNDSRQCIHWSLKKEYRK